MNKLKSKLKKKTCETNSLKWEFTIKLEEIQDSENGNLKRSESFNDENFEDIKTEEFKGNETVNLNGTHHFKINIHEENQSSIEVKDCTQTDLGNRMSLQTVLMIKVNAKRTLTVIYLQWMTNYHLQILIL